MQVVKEKGLQHLQMNSSQILALLESKHADDLFVGECKNGETWGARDLLKLDAWVLKRTYSPLSIVGYEIKCSRADFEQDQKWVGYLDLCHTFFFVCPAGLIRSTDLPSRVGLIWVSASGKLHTKKKAEYVQPDTAKLNRLLIYVLMARTKIVNDRMYTVETTPVDKLDKIRKIVEESEKKDQLAHFVKGHIHNIEQALKKKELSLITRENFIKEYERRLTMLGITWDSTSESWSDNNKVQDEIALLKKNIDQWTVEQMSRLGDLLIKTSKQIQELNGRT